MIGMSKTQYNKLVFIGRRLEDQPTNTPEAQAQLKVALDVLTDVCNWTDDEMSDMPHSWFKTADGKAALEWSATVEAAADQVRKELGLEVSVVPQTQPELPAAEHLWGLMQTPRGF